MRRVKEKAPVGSTVVLLGKDDGHTAGTTGVVVALHGTIPIQPRWLSVRMTSGPLDGEIRTLFPYQVRVTKLADQS